MEIIALILVVLLVAAAAYEIRLRKPDQTVLHETPGGIRVRPGRFYARHFGIPMTRTTHSFTQTVEASARGNLDVRVKLAVTVAASMENLTALVRIGGWSDDATARAAKELEVLLLGFVKEFAEGRDIDAISSEALHAHLLQRGQGIAANLGIDVITLTVTSLEPVNAQIADALRQREQARILEQAEALQQQARVAASRTRLRAEEEIAAMESSLETKKHELRERRLAEESKLNAARADHDLKLKKMQLEFEKEEMRVLRENPELLLLTPQAARLAEASQSLKNARTVVSLASPEGGQGTDVIGVFQNLLQGAVAALKQKKEH
jgi:hypothetical protein